MGATEKLQFRQSWRGTGSVLGFAVFKTALAVTSANELLARRTADTAGRVSDAGVDARLERFPQSNSGLVFRLWEIECDEIRTALRSRAPEAKEALKRREAPFRSEQRVALCGMADACAHCGCDVAVSVLRRVVLPGAFAIVVGGALQGWGLSRFLIPYGLGHQITEGCG
jgi:hypothetical protein